LSGPKAQAYVERPQVCGDVASGCNEGLLQCFWSICIIVYGIVISSCDRRRRRRRRIIIATISVSYSLLTHVGV
jgi:hypothetical protein